MFIYLLRHKRTGKEYVGKTIVSLRSRLYGHKARAKSGAAYPIAKAIQEDGIDAFEMTLLAQAESHEELWRLEQRFIEERHTLHPDGYNLVRGGRGNFGWQMPKDTRRKIAASRLGRAPWNKGKKMPYQSRASKGKPKTEAQLAAVRSAHARAASAAVGARNTGKKRDRAKWAEVARRTHAERSPEAKARWVEAERRSYSARSREAKEHAAALVSIKKRQWWASLTPEARAAHITAMRGAATPRHQGA